MPGDAAPQPKSASPGLSAWLRRRRLILFLLVAHLVGLLSSVDALMSTRTAQGTIAWVVSLNAVPYVAVPAYWVLGRSRFQGYIISRRDEDSAIAGRLNELTTDLWTHRSPGAEYSKELRAVEQLAKMPFLQGNRVDLLIDGEATFDSLFEGIESARDYLLVQSYIIRDDALGRALQQRLIERARAGVDVYLLYDEIGSYRLTRNYLRELSDAGVNVHRFHSTRGPGNVFQFNFRNHRKVVVADGERAWVGGFNIGSEYLGTDPRFGAWRDTHMRIEGPAALGLQIAFFEDWHWATEEILDLSWTPALSAEADVPVLILPSGPADRFETASLMIQKAIQSAERRVWISSPYFAPDEGVQGMLKLAALGGVDVRILIPERPDHWALRYAAYAFIDPLLEAGVSVYRYQPGFLHSKAFLIDDAGAAVGTVNLNNRSFRLDFEVTAIAIDEDFATEVEAMFLADFERSRLMQRSDLDDLPLWVRVTSRAVYLFAPIL